MTTSNAADAPAKGGTEKGHEKLAEKRRALGRGLESLLPGPRVVPTVPTLPQGVRKDGAPSAKDEAHLVKDGPAAPAVSPATAGTVEVLQASASDQAATGDYTLELGLDQIDENPYQTRKEFDPKALTDLAGSIQSQGVLQPIVVRPRSFHPGIPPPGPQRFILILGERRFRASKMAGKTTIPAIVKRVSQQQAAEMTLVENLQRQDLDCLEQAQAFANLSTQFNMTQEEIGKRVGVSREQVSNYLRLLKLPPTVLMALRNRDLTYSHARLLLSLNDDKQIIKVAEVAIAKKMSVALLTDMVANIDLPKRPIDERKSGGARWVDPNVRSAQRTLELVLGMRVRIRDRKGKGKIIIEYGHLDDFDLLIRLLKGAAGES